MFKWLFGRGPIRVVDADTVECDGVRYRLMGFDSPEPLRQNAKSEHEIVIGKKATARLQQLLAEASKVSLRPKGRRRDKHGRGLAQLFLDGRDVSEIAIHEGWGREFHGRGPRPDWTEA